MKFFCTLNILNCATCKTIFFSLRSLKSKKRAWQATFKHPRREILLCEGKNFKLYNHEETDSPFSLKGYQIKVSFFFFFFFVFTPNCDLKNYFRGDIYFIWPRIARNEDLRVWWNRRKQAFSVERVKRFHILRLEIFYRKIIKYLPNI